jgi:hypothetical protein
MHNPSYRKARRERSQFLSLAFLFLFLSAIFSGLFLIDPTQSYYGFSEIKLIKYLPIELGFFSILFYALSGRRVSVRVGLLLLLGMIVLLGGIYTAVIQKQSLMDTFVGRGLALFLVYPAYCMATSEQQTRLFWRLFSPYLLLLAVVIFVGLLVWSSGYHFISEPHIYHTQVLIPVSAGFGVFLVFRKRSPLFAYIVGPLLMSAGIVLFKNTGFLVVLFALVMIVFIIWHTPAHRSTLLLKRGLIGIIGLGFVISLLGALTQVDLVVFYSNYMPSGSPSVRVFTYLKRIDMFLESPVYGTLFVGSPIEVMSTKYGEIAIPSHSDILDILAFGGGGALLLFLLPIFSVLWGMRRNLKVRVMPQYGMFLWAYAYTGMGMIVLSVNPIWNQPESISLFMLTVGVLLAFSEKVGRVNMVKAG